MIKMSNHNITQRGTQATGLGVMIGMCSLDSQHGRLDRHPANAGCSPLFINEESNRHDQRPKRKTWTREDNQLALQCYFKSNPSQRRYRKRMSEIWQKCASFQTTSQRLADQVRTIIKRGRFSDLKILEIHQKTHKQNYDTVLDTSSSVKQKQPNADKKKSTKTGQNNKTKKDAGICRNRQEKATREKITVQLEEINPKVLAKEGRLKRYRQRVKQYRQNRTFQNNERKFYQQLEGDNTKTYQQPDAKETQRF